MISAPQIRDILSLYHKFGWTLRRVLLTPKLKKNLADSIGELFSKAEIIDSQIDAAWFTRPSGTNKVAWELRRLSEIPYALFEVFGKDDEVDFCEEKRRKMEARLK